MSAHGAAAGGRCRGRRGPGVLPAGTGTLSPSEIRHRHLSASARGQGVTDSCPLHVAPRRFCSSGGARVPREVWRAAEHRGRSGVLLGRAAGQRGHREGWPGAWALGRRCLRAASPGAVHAPTRAPLRGQSWGQGQCPFPASSHRAGPLLASNALLCSFTEHEHPFSVRYSADFQLFFFSWPQNDAIHLISGAP